MFGVMTPDDDVTANLSSELGRIGAHVSWGRTKDRSARTAPARAAMDAKFLAEAEGDPVRAEHLRKAYYRNLARKSAETRRRNREAREADGVMTPMPNAPKTPLRSFRIPDDVYEAAQAKAKERGETVSDVVRAALERYAKRK